MNTERKRLEDTVNPSLSEGATQGLVSLPPAPATASWRPRDIDYVDSPFMGSLDRELALRRKCLLTQEWAIAASIAALVGWVLFISVTLTAYE